MLSPFFIASPLKKMDIYIILVIDIESKISLNEIFRLWLCLETIVDLCGNQKTAAKLKTLMDLKNTDSGHAGNQNKLLKE